MYTVMCFRDYSVGFVDLSDVFIRAADDYSVMIKSCGCKNRSGPSYTIDSKPNFT